MDEQQLAEYIEATGGECEGSDFDGMHVEWEG